MRQVIGCEIDRCNRATTTLEFSGYVPVADAQLQNAFPWCAAPHCERLRRGKAKLVAVSYGSIHPHRTSGRKRDAGHKDAPSCVALNTSQA